MKSKSGPPKGSKNASKGGRDAAMSLRVPTNLKEAIKNISIHEKSLGARTTPADIVNSVLSSYVKAVYPEIAEEYDL